MMAVSNICSRFTNIQNVDYAEPSDCGMHLMVYFNGRKDPVKLDCTVQEFTQSMIFPVPAGEPIK